MKNYRTEIIFCKEKKNQIFEGWTDTYNWTLIYYINVPKEIKINFNKAYQENNKLLFGNNL